MNNGMWLALADLKGKEVYFILKNGGQINGVYIELCGVTGNLAIVLDNAYGRRSYVDPKEIAVISIIKEENETSDHTPYM